MYKNYRKYDIEEKMHKMKVRPLDVMVTGATGAGKSTTLNALFERYVAKVGDGVDPETMELTAYSLNEVARFWDTPGIGDGYYEDRKHEQKIKELLYKTYTTNNGETYGWIDLVLIIIEGITRDMGSTYRLLNDIIIPNFQSDRILIAINQCDVAMKGRHWNNYDNCPDYQLKEFLDDKVFSIKQRIYESTNVNIIKPIYYSAEYDYNIETLMDLIIDNIPFERRPLFKY